MLALVVGDQVRWSPAGTDIIRAGMEMVVVATRRGIAAAVERGEQQPPAAAQPLRQPSLRTTRKCDSPKVWRGVFSAA